MPSDPVDDRLTEIRAGHRAGYLPDREQIAWLLAQVEKLTTERARFKRLWEQEATRAVEAEGESWRRGMDRMRLLGERDEAIGLLREVGAYSHVAAFLQRFPIESTPSDQEKAET